jgi:FdhD protein
MRTPVAQIAITRIENGTPVAADDLLVAEEPLEIQLGHGPEHDRTETRLSVTMRTPGNDEELALGFLFTEGIITNTAQVVRVAYCEQVKPEERGNVVRAEPPAAAAYAARAASTRSARNAPCRWAVPSRSIMP